MDHHNGIFTTAAKARGFNLIELFIVTAIVMICAGLGLPSLQKNLAETRATLYLGELSRDIVYMRSYAISHMVPVTLCPLEHGRCSSDWTKQVSVFIDHNLNLALGGDDRLLKVIHLPQPTDTFSYPRRGVTFRSDGSINGFQAGTFRYCPLSKDSLFSKGLVISQAGRSRFRDKDISCIQ